MFLTSFNAYFVLGYACFMCICLKTTLWLFLGQGLAFFGEDRLATLSKGTCLSEEEMGVCPRVCRAPTSGGQCPGAALF